MKNLFKSASYENSAKFIYDYLGSMTNKEVVSYQAEDLIVIAKGFVNGDVNKTIELLRKALESLVEKESLVERTNPAKLQKSVK